MNFVKKHWNSLVFLGVMAMLAYKQVPLWMHSNQQLEQTFDNINVIDLSEERIKIPKTDAKKVYVFWATWCSPCHLQLALFDKAVKSQTLQADQVIAVSLDRSFEDLKSFVKEKNYSFTTVMASSDQSWADLNVQATPSIAFVQNKRVVDFFTGISPLAVYKADKFLSN